MADQEKSQMEPKWMEQPDRIAELEAELEVQRTKYEKLRDDLELAWVIIANASGGDWRPQTPEWRAAVVRFRDLYHGYISAELVAEFEQNDLGADIRASNVTLARTPFKPVVDTSNDAPTHRCKVCGALWWSGIIDNGVDQFPSWSLRSPKCGPCCDNVAMGEQIESIG